MWYGKNQFRDENTCKQCKCCHSNDEWAPTVVIQKECNCKRDENIAALKAELEKIFE